VLSIAALCEPIYPTPILKNITATNISTTAKKMPPWSKKLFTLRLPAIAA
jgi:hypothetical protein